MDSNEDSLPIIPSTNSSITLWDEVAAILSALIGGGKYGLKIRVPHALVMTFLFSKNMSFRKKIHVIAKLAAEHASNLAAFACVYKVSGGDYEKTMIVLYCCVSICRQLLNSYHIIYISLLPCSSCWQHSRHWAKE